MRERILHAIVPSLETRCHSCYLATTVVVRISYTGMNLREPKGGTPRRCSFPLQPECRPQVTQFTGLPPILHIRLLEKALELPG